MMPGSANRLTEIELPLAGVLARMSAPDLVMWTRRESRHSQEAETRISTLTDAIFEAVGHEFNINSPKQLGVALFEDLGLPKKNKSGYSTVMPRCWRFCPPGGGNYGISHTD